MFSVHLPSRLVLPRLFSAFDNDFRCSSHILASMCFHAMYHFDQVELRKPFLAQTLRGETLYHVTGPLFPPVIML